MPQTPHEAVQRRKLLDAYSSLDRACRAFADDEDEWGYNHLANLRQEFDWVINKIIEKKDWPLR